MTIGLKVGDKLINTEDLQGYEVIKTDNKFVAYACHFNGTCSKIKPIYLEETSRDNFIDRWSYEYNIAVNKHNDQMQDKLHKFRKSYSKYMI